MSKDLHDLLDCLTDSKLLGLSRGRESDELESIILEDSLREPSFVAEKAMSSCPLGKVSKFGKSRRGQMQAVNRRAWAKDECDRRDDATGWAMCLAGGSTMEGGIHSPPPWPSDTSSVEYTFR